MNPLYLCDKFLGMRVLFTFIITISLYSCGQETSICSCYRNDAVVPPEKQKKSIKEKCETLKADWESRYKSGSDSLKKAMDDEFNEAIANCKG